MSYNRFYNNFTFQRNFVPNFAVPPPPPQLFLPPPPPVTTDWDVVTQFEAKITVTNEKFKPKCVSITKARDRLQHMVLLLNSLKDKQKQLLVDVNTMSETEWAEAMRVIEESKVQIDAHLSELSLHTDTLRKALSKRTAKRLRLKRAAMIKKREREEWNQKKKEKSLKIDENLQKIKDDVLKAKQEEEAKLQADIVLKEVLRKKQDAKRLLLKLDAMLKLRRARQNTARGRGETVSERDAIAFENNIEKLKALWTSKLSQYEIEETELRAQLKQDKDSNIAETLSGKETEIVENLEHWRLFLFGGQSPQVDFNGDLGRFIAVRSQWDQYVDEQGTSLPAGWVAPPTDTPVSAD